MEDVLRFWEPADYFIVVGYANRVATEVNVACCRERGIPIRRRCSGGGTVLQGPGCLNYSLILRTTESGPLAGITGTNDYVMERHRQMFSALLQKPVAKQGHTDLAIGGLKFSGNAQRRRQHSVLFHGCILLNLDISLVEQALPQPSSQPAYRLNRSHRDFLMNLGVPASRVKAALIEAWGATVPLEEPPAEAIRRLAQEKYGTDTWNLRF
jgi:lipoate-protein ligase A